MRYLSRSMFLSIIFLAAFLLSIGSAEPFLAVKNGFKCSQCHVNHTGGGKRTDFGYIYTQTMLPRKFVPGGDFQKDLAPGIKTGANFRFENQTRFAESDEPQTSNVNIPEGNLYAELELVRGYFSLYLDQRVAPSMESREAFIIAHTPKASGYLKAGKMLQPFGWRLYDDDTYTRKVTQFTYATPRLGIEAGWEPGPLSASVSLAESQASVMAYMLWNGVPYLNTVRIGGSGYRTHPSLDRAFDWKDSDQEYGFGAFLGWGFRKLAFLGELDNKRARENGLTVWKQFGLVEANLMAAKGLNLKLGLDWLNPNTNAVFSRNGQSRFVVGTEFFPIQFFEVGAYYHFRQAIPDNPRANQDELRLQIHAFY